MEKKRLREMTWEDYGITRHRYEELRAFCLQYEEKKREIAKGTAGFRNHAAAARTGTEDPAKRAALRRRRHQKDLEMIEEAARAACPGDRCVHGEERDEGSFLSVSGIRPGAWPDPHGEDGLLCQQEAVLPFFGQAEKWGQNRPAPVIS